MTAAVRPITIEQGATFKFKFTWKDSLGVPVNLTGYTARMQVRKTVNDPNKALDFTTENGAIVLGGVLGTVDITGDAVATAAVTIKTGVYDIELVSTSDFVTRIFEGPATISPEVTK